MLKFPSTFVRRRNRKERKVNNDSSSSYSKNSCSKHVSFSMDNISHEDNDWEENDDCNNDLIHYSREDFERIRIHNNTIIKLLEENKTTSASGAAARIISRRHSNNDTTNDVVTIMDTNGQEQEVCFRGLEHITEIGAQNRRKVVQRAVTAVLAEQDRQKYFGGDGKGGGDSKSNMNPNPDMIADIYKGYTLSCKKTAQRYGKLDAQAVKKIILKSTTTNDDATKSLSSFSMPKKKNLNPTITTKKQHNNNTNNNPRRYHNRSMIVGGGSHHDEVHTHIPRSFFH